MIVEPVKTPQCSFCNSTSLTKVLDLGQVALAGAFLKPDEFDQECFYPLRLFFCDQCFAVQVVDKVSPNVLFGGNYFYFSSSIRTLSDHFKEYAAEVTTRFLSPEKSTVVEFGCNDGVLLRPFADHKVRTVIGVDPASNVVKTIDDPRITVINSFFNEETARTLVSEYGKADLVCANNVYAHISDIQGITRAIRDVLADDGVFVFEVHYLTKIINEFQYDMIYHEHLYYYSLLALTNHLARYDMTIFDVKPVPIHAGSMRYYACKKGSRYATSESSGAAMLRNAELRAGFHQVETYLRFGSEVAKSKETLMDLLHSLKSAGKTIAGYGASGRANTIIQFCGIDHRHLQYMIDDAPAKTGFYTPGSHFLIHSREILESKSRPDYLLVFAWSFLDEIARKCSGYLRDGGRLIVPLPEAKVLNLS